MSALLWLVLTNAATAGVLAALAWIASRLSRRQGLVHGLWLLAVVKLVTPPVLPLRVLPAWSSLRLSSPAVVVVPIPPSVHREQTPAAARRASVGNSVPAILQGRRLSSGLASSLRHELATPVQAARVAPRLGPALATGASRSLDLATAVTSLLAVSALAILALTAWRFLGFQRRLIHADPAAEPLTRRAEELGRRLGLRRIPTVCLIREALPPMLWPATAGLRLVLPAGLLARLTGEELDSLLAHELAHVRRGDHWVRLVEVAATALFWWYPVTWWSRRALRRAEERCCDEWVLRVLPSSAAAYASGLLKSLTFVSGEPAPLPVGASGAGPAHDLEARLKEILMTRPLPQLSRPLRVALAAAAAIGLAVFPTSAQPRSVGDTPAPAVAAPAEAAQTPAAAAPAVTAAPATPGTPAMAATPPRARRPVAAMAPRGATAIAVPPRAVVAGVPGGVVGGVPGGVVGGVPGGIVGGVPGGIVGGVTPRALIAGIGPAILLAGDDDPALAAERHALEDQRRKLHEQEIEIERRSLDLEARAERAQRKAEADRLRAEGKTAELARVEQQGQLSTRRFDLQTRQLQLEAEHSKLEAELEQAARADEERVAALEKAGQDKQADELRRELEHAQEAREHATLELEKKQQALEADMQKAEQEQQAFESEQRVRELRSSSEELVQTLTERLDALREALPEAGTQKAALEAEMRKLQSAIDALGGATPKPLPHKTPRAQP